MMIFGAQKERARGFLKTTKKQNLNVFPVKKKIMFVFNCRPITGLTNNILCVCRLVMLSFFKFILN